MKKFFWNVVKTAEVVAKNHASVCENLDVHVNITKTWAIALGNAMAFSEEEKEILAIAAEFHDLGKKFVWEVVTSPEKATEMMRKLINTHSVSGAVMAFFKCLALGKKFTFACRVFKIVLCHHDLITGCGVNGFKVSDKLTQTLTISDIIAARCYDDPTRNYPVDLATPVTLAEDLAQSANFNSDVLAKVEVVHETVAKELEAEYGIVESRI